MSTKKSTEITLVGSKLCLPCQEIEERLKDKIDKGEISYKDINDPEVQEILGNDSEQVAVPFAIVKQDKTIKVCTLAADDEVVLAVCGKDIIPLLEPGQDGQDS